MDERALSHGSATRWVAYPAVTVPAGYLDGQPFGAIFTGRKWSEPDLVAYSYAYEQSTHAWRSPATINPDFAAACAS